MPGRAGGCETRVARVLRGRKAKKNRGRTRGRNTEKTIRENDGADKARSASAWILQDTAATYVRTTCVAEEAGARENVFIARGSYGSSYRRVITLIAAIKSRCHPRGAPTAPRRLCALRVTAPTRPAFFASAMLTYINIYIYIYTHIRCKRAYRSACIARPANIRSVSQLVQTSRFVPPPRRGRRISRGIVTAAPAR